MERHLLAPALLCVSLLTPALAYSQAPAAQGPVSHYKLVFRLLQLDGDGKITNSRRYETMIGVGGDQGFPTARIRSGDRVPIQVESGKFDYSNVGTDIDAIRPAVRDRQLSLHVSADSSSAVEAPGETSRRPVLRDTRWEADVEVALGKPTIIFTSDNLSDPGKLELELTATDLEHH
jgi:hypothetical protein